MILLKSLFTDEYIKKKTKGGKGLKRLYFTGHSLGAISAHLAAKCVQAELGQWWDKCGENTDRAHGESVNVNVNENRSSESSSKNFQQHQLADIFKASVNVRDFAARKRGIKHERISISQVKKRKRFATTGFIEVETKLTLFAIGMLSQILLGLTSLVFCCAGKCARKKKKIEKICYINRDFKTCCT